MLTVDEIVNCNPREYKSFITWLVDEYNLFSSKYAYLYNVLPDEYCHGFIINSCAIEVDRRAVKNGTADWVKNDTDDTKTVKTVKSDTGKSTTVEPKTVKSATGKSEPSLKERLAECVKHNLSLRVKLNKLNKLKELL